MLAEERKKQYYIMIVGSSTIKYWCIAIESIIPNYYNTMYISNRHCVLVIIYNIYYYIIYYAPA